MAEDMSVKAVISAVDQGFNKTLQNAINQLEKLPKTSNGAGGSMTKMGAVFGAASAIAGKAVSTIGSGISGMLGDLSQSSATWKTFSQNMKGFGASGKQISSVKKELQSYAQATIYSSSDMASTYAQLAAVGVKGTDQLVTGFGGLASAAEDPQQAMKTLSQQATQMAAKPMVQWQDFKLMLEQTPAGIAGVAKTMGESTSQLVTDVQNGKVSTEDFFNAIKKTGNNDTFSKMATQYKTVGQAMDGLKETAVNKLQPAFDQVSSYGIKAVSKLTDWMGTIDFSAIGSNITGAIQTLIPIAQSVGSFLGQAFSAALPIVKQVADSLVTGFKMAWPTIKQLATLIGGVLVSGLKLASGAYSKFSDAMKNPFVQSVVVGITAAVVAFKTWQAAITAWQAVTKIATGVQAAFNLVMDANPIMLIVIAIAAVVAALVYFFTQTKLGQQIWAGFMSWLSSAWTAIVSVAQSIWTGLATFFTGLWTGIVNGATGIWAGLTAAWTAVVAGAQAIWTVLVAFFSALWAGIVATATGLWCAFGPALSTIWQGIVSIASGVWNMLKAVIMAPVLFVIDLVTGNFKALSGDLSLIWDAIKSAVSQVWNGIKTVVSGVVKFIVTFVKTAFTGMKTVVSGIWNGLKSLASSAWNGIKSTVVSAAKALVNGAKNAFTAFKSFMTGLWSGIKSLASSAWNGIKSTVVNAVKNLVSSAKSAFDGLRHIDLAAAGKAIINGFLKGITSAFSAVKNFVGGIASWIRDHKGPISYDKKLLIPAGAAIMGGLNAGLIDNFTSVQNTVSGMSDAIASAMNPQLNLSSINGTIAGVNRQLQQGISASVDSSVAVSRQPANVTLNMGGSTYSAYIDDINHAQAAKAQLKSTYTLRTN